jgi:hypothetical protein
MHKFVGKGTEFAKCLQIIIVKKHMLYTLAYYVVQLRSAKTLTLKSKGILLMAHFYF